MKKRLLWAGLTLICLLPILQVSTFDGWIPPWRSAELDACVGDYLLPSGVVLRIYREENMLRAGEPPRELRRAARWFYVGKSDPIRVRFEVDDEGDVDGLKLSGLSPQTPAERIDHGDRDSAAFVDIGGHRLRVNVAGREHGGPTVLLETGPLGGLEGLAQWQADVAKFARVVAYDHPGTGGSEPGPQPQTAAEVARQLRTALRELSVEPPFVVAGMSMGGPYSQVFAHLYPEDVSGLVWIDPTPDWSQLYAWCVEHAPDLGKRVKRTLQWVDLSVEKRLHDSAEVGRRSEWHAMDQTWDQVRAALPLPSVPVVQITGAKDFRTRDAVATKVEYFESWLAEHAPEARHVLAEESGHGVYATEPELVLEAIRTLVEGKRAEVW